MIFEQFIEGESMTFKRPSIDAKTSKDQESFMFSFFTLPRASYKTSTLLHMSSYENFEVEEELYQKLDTGRLKHSCPFPPL